MPVREAKEKEPEQKVKAKAAPEKKKAVKKDSEPVATKEAKGVIKMNPTEKKFKGYLKKLGLDDKVFEVKTVRVKEADAARDVSFATFSTNGDKDESLDEEFNKQCIKDVLFDYHTENKAGNDIISVSVLDGDADNPFILAYQVLNMK